VRTFERPCKLLHSHEIAEQRVRPGRENVHRFARQRAAAHAIVTSIAASQPYRKTTDRASVIQWEERSVGTCLPSSKRLSVDRICSLDARGNVVGGAG